MPELKQHLPQPPQAIKQDVEAEFLEAVARARAGLRFGSIEIIVHEGKVTQIERKEKFRLSF